jgi:prepilin-type N-terminal cleavage/methylation domain-containing protein
MLISTRCQVHTILVPMRGVTLPELVLAVAIAGLTAGLGVPRIAALRDRLAVEREAAALLVAYQRARLVASTTGQPVRLLVTAERLSAYTLRAGDSSLAWQAPGPAAVGVQLVAIPAPPLFVPGGVTIGVSNGRYVLSKGGVSRTLIASRLGRLRVARP